MVEVYTVSGGKTKKDIQLPDTFNTPYRPDIIKRAFDALKSNTRQPQGMDPSAGLKTSADYFGNRRRSYRVTINRAMSRLPRTKPGGGGLGPVRRVPQSVGGRRAHPPKAEKKLGRKINKKEYKLALDSAIAATANKQIVAERNKKHSEVGELPIIVEDKLQKINKTRDLKTAIKKLGLTEHMQSKRKNRILIVVDEDEGIRQAASNMQGIRLAKVNELDLDLLAPGSQAGVLTVYTEAAIKKMGEQAK